VAAAPLDLGVEVPLEGGEACEPSDVIAQLVGLKIALQRRYPLARARQLRLESHDLLSFTEHALVFIGVRPRGL